MTNPTYLDIEPHIADVLTLAHELVEHDAVDGAPLLIAEALEGHAKNAMQAFRDVHEVERRQAAAPVHAAPVNRPPVSLNVVTELVNEIDNHVRDFNVFFQAFGHYADHKDIWAAGYNEAVRIVHRMDDSMREIGAIRDQLEAMLGNEPDTMTRHRILNALRRKLWPYPDVTDETALAAARELIQ